MIVGDDPTKVEVAHMIVARVAPEWADFHQD